MYNNMLINLAVAGCMMLIIHSANGQTARADNKIFSRKYKEGETYRYRLTTQVVHNGQPQATEVAECSVKVALDSAGIPFDEITWVSHLSIKGKDTVNNQAIARSVKPYRISLHPSGKIDMPLLDVAVMTGAITDFNTFFVAVGPQLGALQLVNKGDSVVKHEPVTGDFSNGKTILKGQDCLAVSIYMKEKSDSTVLLQTNFLPPAQNCLTWLTNDMNTAVMEGGPNNFQMVQPSGAGRYNVHYGREMFIIASTIQRSDGKLVKAEMSNTLFLKTKIQCDASYTNCQGPYPFKIERFLKLELLR